MVQEREAELMEAHNIRMHRRSLKLSSHAPMKRVLANVPAGADLSAKRYGDAPRDDNARERCLSCHELELGFGDSISRCTRYANLTSCDSALLFV